MSDISRKLEASTKKRARPALASAEDATGASLTRRGAARSEEMLHAAANLFLEKGYDGTSVDEVVQIAGGSKTHVYREFGDKQGLFLASVRYLCAEVQLPLDTLDVSALPFEEGLHALATQLVRVLLGERHLAFQRLVFAEASRFHEVGEIWYARGPQMSHGVFSRHIAQAMRSGLLRTGDADLAARLFCDMISGHILDRAWLGLGKKPTAVQTRQTIDAAIELLLRGYVAESKRPTARVARFNATF